FASSFSLCRWPDPRVPATARRSTPSRRLPRIRKDSGRNSCDTTAEIPIFGSARSSDIESSRSTLVRCSPGACVGPASSGSSLWPYPEQPKDCKSRGEALFLMGMDQKIRGPKSRAALVMLIAAAAVGAAACDRASVEAKKRIAPEYDKKTGKLTLLKYDSNGNGKIDTWSYMDGARVVRIEIDKDENGTIDRWEYYGADQKLEKTGFSRANDGKEDAWSYAGPDGSVERIEISTRRDGKVSRIERFRNNVLVSAEEDGDGDGRMDKWETYDRNRLASVAFDTTGRGTPDRRLIYGTDGSARVAVGHDGTGHFVAVANPGRPRRAARR